MDESEETICQLIKPGSNPPILLQFVEEAFYYMRFPVPDEVTAAWINGIVFRWNAEISIPIGNILPEFKGVVCLVGQYGSPVWFQFNMIQNVFRYA